MDERIIFHDEDGNDISDLVRVTSGKATPFHSSGIFTYAHPVLGDVDIGSHSSGHVSTRGGYSHKIEAG